MKSIKLALVIFLLIVSSVLTSCDGIPSSSSSNSSSSSSPNNGSSSTNPSAPSESTSSPVSVPSVDRANGLWYVHQGSVLYGIGNLSGEPLSGKVVIPSCIDGNVITSISPYSYIFRDKSLITEVVFPDTITFLPNGIFWGCTGLKKVTLPQHLSEIPECAFHNCSSLSQIIIPDSVYSICNDAFYNCSLLKTIVLPYNTIRIGTSSFAGCESLEYVYLPKSLMLLSTSAFPNSRSLKAIYYEGSEEDWNKIETYWGKPSHFLTDKLVFNTPAPSYPRS